MFDQHVVSLNDAKFLMREWRETNVRKSDEIVNFWELVLSIKLEKLGLEKHLIIEQAFTAALDCGLWNIAEECLAMLQAEFAGSLRVKKYNSMLLEALERFDDASDVLNSVINIDGTNAASRKRKTAICMSQGRYGEAIKELCEYLKMFMSDQDAWHQLCNLYLSELDFSKANFCMEELLLHNPYSHFINQKIADIRYSAGGTENYEISKFYYSQALKMNPNNMRALYGLLLCYIQLLNSKSNIGKKKDTNHTIQWVLQQIATKEQKGLNTTKVFQKMLVGIDVKLSLKQ